MLLGSFQLTMYTVAPAATRPSSLRNVTLVNAPAPPFELTFELNSPVRSTFQSAPAGGSSEHPISSIRSGFARATFAESRPAHPDAQIAASIGARCAASSHRKGRARRMLQPQLGARASESIDYRVHDRACRFYQIWNISDAHSTESFLELGRAIPRRPWEPDPCTRYPETTDQRAVGLTTELGRFAMRTSLHKLPSAARRLDDPVIRIGRSPGTRAEHLPVHLDLRMARPNRPHGLGELRLHVRRARSRITPDVEIDFRGRRRESGLLRPTGAHRGDFAFRRDLARRIARGVFRDPRLELLNDARGRDYRAAIARRAAWDSRIAHRAAHRDLEPAHPRLFRVHAPHRLHDDREVGRDAARQHMIDAVAHPVIAAACDIDRHPAACKANLQITGERRLRFEDGGCDFSQRRDHALRIRCAEAVDHLAFCITLRDHVGAQDRPRPGNVVLRVAFQMCIDRRVKE